VELALINVEVGCVDEVDVEAVLGCGVELAVGGDGHFVLNGRGVEDEVDLLGGGFGRGLLGWEGEDRAGEEEEWEEEHCACLVEVLVAVWCEDFGCLKLAFGKKELGREPCFRMECCCFIGCGVVFLIRREVANGIGVWVIIMMSW
jgi:hypothetical protein